MPVVARAENSCRMHRRHQLANREPQEETGREGQSGATAQRSGKYFARIFLNSFLYERLFEK